MKRMFFAAVAAVGLVAAGEVEKESGVKALPSARADAFRQSGGFVIKQDKGNGRVLIANTVKDLPAKACRQPVGYMRVHAKMSMDTEFVDAALAEKPTARSASALNATLVVFVVRDGSSGTTIQLAPDEHWAKVNVAALNADEPGDEILIARVRKAVTRAVCFLCGGCGSQYGNTLVGAFRDPVKDYDRFADNGLPIDVFPRLASYVKGLGMRPIVRASYRVACEEGWAPAPTNDVQRAIWDKVHAPPSKPVKIQYDKAKQKPVVK